jgi:hypothetical protein
MMQRGDLALIMVSGWGLCLCVWWLLDRWYRR